MEYEKLKKIIEAILLSAEKPMSIPQLDALFEIDNDKPTRDEIRKALTELEEEYRERSFELKQVSSGFRLQVKQDYADWVGRLWEEKPQRYSRALLETLALIAYRQPITRGEIEEVRGVSVSSTIIKTCLEREWIKVLGHKDVPGKPALYGTTREFLDYFNLKSLEELPTLAEIKDIDQIHPELAFGEELDEDDSSEAEASVTGSDEVNEDAQNAATSDDNDAGVEESVVDEHEQESAEGSEEVTAEDVVDDNIEDEVAPAESVLH